jgi:hypothetical protein
MPKLTGSVSRLSQTACFDPTATARRRRQAAVDGRDGIASGCERPLIDGDGHGSDAARFASNGSRCEREDDLAEGPSPRFPCEGCRFEREGCPCKDGGGLGIHLESLFDAVAVKEV